MLISPSGPEPVMETPEPPPPHTRSRRPHLRITVQALMILVLVLGGGLGWLVNRANCQRDAAATIERQGGNAVYDWQLPTMQWGRAGRRVPTKKPNAPPAWKQWVAARLGPDYV